MNVAALLNDVKETDQPLKAIASKHGLKQSYQVTKVCLAHGLSKSFLKERAKRMNRLNASKPRSAGDDLYRLPPDEIIDESMTGDGLSLRWLKQAWTQVEVQNG